MSDSLVHEGLKNLKFSQIVHMLVGLIMYSVLKIEHMAFLCLLTLCIYINAECEFLDSHKHFVILIHQTC